MKIIHYILPEHWASALINADYSGYSAEEIAEINEFCDKVKGVPCMPEEESYFAWRNDANNLGATVAEFPFIYN